MRHITHHINVTQTWGQEALHYVVFNNTDNRLICDKFKETPKKGLLWSKMFPSAGGAGR